MTARRGATDLAGVLLVDKPPGLTSHDVLLAVRHATGERRIGHAGTLDPMATGLLFVLVGVATRLERYLVGHDKSYRARISFGVATDTLDAEGAVTGTAPVPPDTLTEGAARQLLLATLGPQDQDPPAYSAIKTDGVPAHRTARAGGTPVLEPRPITVHAAELVAIDADASAWDVDFRVSKGTYVRALARDLGAAAGTVAHLTGLRRTAVGETGVRDSHPLAAVLDAAERGEVASLFTDPVRLLDMRVHPATAADVADGRPIAAAVGEYADAEAVVLADPERIHAVYRFRDGLLRAETVFPGGVAR